MSKTDVTRRAMLFTLTSFSFVDVQDAACHVPSAASTPDGACMAADQQRTVCSRGGTHRDACVSERPVTAR